MKVGMRPVWDVAYSSHRNCLRDIWAFKQTPGTLDYETNMGAAHTHMLRACDVPLREWEKYGK